MMRTLWALLVLQAFFNVKGLFQLFPKLELGKPDGDPGCPLFLSQFVEKGNIEEGRLLAFVPFTETYGVRSYAGYFTVNKTYDSNHFFWYFPAMTNKSLAPVVVWLQGGPGVTSLYGLFTENGPFTVKNNSFEKREYHWALSHHLIYIDNPVGTGFSFTNDSRGYCTDETQVGEQLYSTVIQFLKLFPELQRNKFFVTGESYGGKYVPALAYTIHIKNPKAELEINLKGIAIGNGFQDPENQLAYSKFLYQIGLIDSNQAKIFQEYENKTLEFIKQANWDKAFETFDLLLNGDMTNCNSLFTNMTGFDCYYNLLRTNTKNEFEDFRPLIHKSAIRKGLHVGNLPFHNCSEVEKHLKQDVMKSVAPLISELLDHYDVAIYTGQLDIVVAYPLTINALRKLNFAGAAEYITAKRKIWKVDGEVAGYVKRAGNLLEVLVRNAGHMAPRDQPKWVLDLITRFTHGTFF